MRCLLAILGAPIFMLLFAVCDDMDRQGDP